MFNSYSTPRPRQDWHIPLGELKENVFGSGFGYDIPVSGHIKFRLKYLGEPDSESRIKIVSLPYFIAIFIDSVKSFFDSKSSPTKRLSITKLIS